MDSNDEVVRLPADAGEMLDFLIDGAAMGKAEELNPIDILQVIHDYACYWLHDHYNPDVPDTHESNMRLN